MVSMQATKLTTCQCTLIKMIQDITTIRVQIDDTSFSENNSEQYDYYMPTEKNRPTACRLRAYG